MAESQTKYWRSLVIGILLIVGGTWLWHGMGACFLPALPGIKVPMSPFLILAGLVLTGASVVLLRDNRDRRDRDSEGNNSNSGSDDDDHDGNEDDKDMPPIDGVRRRQRP